MSENTESQTTADQSRALVKPLALDVSLERARALHRVWRALNDGDCPLCHTFNPASHILRKLPLRSSTVVIQCPECHFGITHEEITAIEKMFAPAMDAAAAIFHQWRKERIGAKSAEELELMGYEGLNGLAGAESV